jgi:predicted secreted protein
MKTYAQVLAVSVALGILNLPDAGRAQDLPPIVLTQTNNGVTTNVVVGQTILVSLRGNITTGYTWVMANVGGDSVVTNGPMSYVSDPGGGVGVGGTFTFPLLAATSGDTSLSFEYRPPGGGLPAETFAVTIHVVPGPPRLSIKLVNANVVISWPIAGATNFFLEGSTTLPRTQWAALNVLPLPEGTNFTVTLGPGTNAVFFRLHRL